jgi:hypothetical protein
MAEVKNLHYLEGVSADVLTKIEHAGTEHRRYSSIFFKIVEYNEKLIRIQVSQQKNVNGIYQTKKRLIEIVHETFDRFFTGKKMQVVPLPYEVAAPAAVNSTWINKQMIATGVKLKEIESETGISKAQLSHLINGTKPLSETAKAMFYFYFLAKTYAMAENAASV